MVLQQRPRSLMEQRPSPMQPPLTLGAVFDSLAEEMALYGTKRRPQPWR